MELTGEESLMDILQMLPKLIRHATNIKLQYRF